MFTACVPFFTAPHLMYSACTRQFVLLPSIFTSMSCACCVRISVRFPMSSFGVKFMFASISALFPSIVSVVSAVSMLVASTMGNSNSATTHACFMLFHCVKCSI